MLGELEADRRWRGCEYGSAAEPGKPTRLSTDKPSYTMKIVRTEKMIRRPVRGTTHPPSMVDKLFAIHFIQPGNPDVVPLRIN